MINTRKPEHMFQNNWITATHIPGIYATELVPIVTFSGEFFLYHRYSVTGYIQLSSTLI